MTNNSIYAALGLSRNPFPPTPDAGSYFFTSDLEEDFAEIEHCIEARKGFVLLTGEVGLGKSTLVRHLLDTLESKRCHSALILNTFLQDSELLSAIQSDFGLSPAATVEQGLANLTAFLITQHQAGDISLLVIDDAQNLTVESLELVRLLCNLETGQEKLLQILLVGQPELEQTLARTELRQLKSRIVKHARLQGLHKDEVIRYFDFRVNAAGAAGRLTIEPAAAEALHSATLGNLRQIHLVLDRCLYGLVGSHASNISLPLLRRAVSDLPMVQDVIASKVWAGGRFRFKAWFMRGALASAVIAIAVASWGLLPWKQLTRWPVVSSTMAIVTPESSAVEMEASPEMGIPASRRVCETQLAAVASADDVIHVRQLPEGLVQNLKSSPRLCFFYVDKDSWVAWLGGNEALHIMAAQRATRKVQEAFKGMGLLNIREPDGLFGSKTGEALARFQRQHGMIPTGQPDELTFLLLEYQNAFQR